MIKSEALFLMVALLVKFNYIHAQIPSLSIVKIDSIMEKNPKPLLMLLSTNWCKYCHLQQKQIKKYLMTNPDKFYFVDFDAETKKDIVFKKTLFKHTFKRDIHQLAVELNGNQYITFPTLIILNTKYELLINYKGLLKSNQIERIINSMAILKE